MYAFVGWLGRPSRPGSQYMCIGRMWLIPPPHGWGWGVVLPMVNQLLYYIWYDSVHADKVPAQTSCMSSLTVMGLHAKNALAHHSYICYTISPYLYVLTNEAIHQSKLYTKSKSGITCTEDWLTTGGELLTCGLVSDFCLKVALTY